MAAPQGYFQKKTEVTELRRLLGNPDVQQQPQKYCRVVQKVIACMTLGIDVAPLFTEMIKASATNNLVQKKLVYLYLCTYAETHPDDAILIINTLRKDASDQNAMIRGLALRSMSSLRIPDLVVHIQTAVVNGMEDRSPYVRATAVLGCLKLYYLAQGAMNEIGLVDKLYKMLHDHDLQVVSNCISALDEILAQEGGMAVNQKIAYYLLNRLGKFSEWSQCQVLDVLKRYQPQSEEEIYDILNVLDDRLKHSNSAVVLGTVKLFLHFSTNLPHLHQDIYQRIKDPLLSVLASCGAEVSYTCLSHIKVMLFKDPELFMNEYKTFFCRHTDPWYVKFIKLEILTMIASHSNVQEIVEELSAYVTDIQVVMSQHSIKAIAKIGLSLSQAAEFCCDTLMLFLTWDIDHVRDETFVALKDMLVKYPQLAASVAPLLREDWELVHDQYARVALVWMVGEFGELVEDSPYLLESLIDSIDQQVTEVKLQLLTSTTKLFFKKPPQCQSMLGRLLEYCIDEEDNMDVRDRALLYYRLLSKTSIDKAKKVICSGTDNPVDVVAEKDSLENVLLKEFNSLSVLYRQPSASFISQVPPYIKGHAEEPYHEDEESVHSSTVSEAMSTPQVATPVQNRSTECADIAVADLLGGGFTVEGDPSPVMDLEPNPALTPEEFERMWKTMTNKTTLELSLTVVPADGELEQTMLKNDIVTIASTPAGLPQQRYYFLAKKAHENVHFLIEANVFTQTSQLRAVVKSEDAAESGTFLQHFRNSLTGRWIALTH